MRLRQVFIGMVAVAISTAGLVALGPTSNAGANPTPGVPPDFVLEPNGPMITREIKSTTIGAPRSDPPDVCRKDPVLSNVCDAYRLKLNLSTNPDAQNFVVIFLEWVATQPPPVSGVLVSLTLAPVPELDLVLYRSPVIQLPPGTAGGQDLNIPERVSFVAKQTEYDIVVKNDQGVSNGYTLRMFMTDEVFGSQFELLDEVQKRIDNPPAPPTAPPADTPAAPPATPGDVSFGGSNSLPPLRPVDDLGLDRRISGIGLGTTTNFDLGGPQVLGPRTQRALNVAKEPSGISLLLALLVLPVLGASGGAMWLRRRRQALI